MSCSTCPCPKYNSPTHNSIQCCDVSEVDSGCKNKCVQNLENSDKVVVVVDGNSVMKRSSQLLNSSYLKNLNENFLFPLLVKIIVKFIYFRSEFYINDELMFVAESI